MKEAAVARIRHSVARHVKWIGPVLCTIFASQAAWAEGVIDVLAAQGGSYISIARIPTESGARTSFFLADEDRFIVAVRSTLTKAASVWIYRCDPSSSR